MLLFQVHTTIDRDDLFHDMSSILGFGSALSPRSIEGLCGAVLWQLVDGSALHQQLVLYNKSISSKY